MLRKAGKTGTATSGLRQAQAAVSLSNGGAERRRGCPVFPSSPSASVRRPAGDACWGRRGSCGGWSASWGASFAGARPAGPEGNDRTTRRNRNTSGVPRLPTLDWIGKRSFHHLVKAAISVKIMRRTAQAESSLRPRPVTIHLSENGYLYSKGWISVTIQRILFRALYSNRRARLWVSSRPSSERNSRTRSE